MAIIDDFKQRFPNFPEADVDTYMPVVSEMWSCYWPQPYKACNKEVILNLIAHLIIVEKSPGTSSIRSQSSRSVGDVSVSFSGVAKQDSLTDFFSFSKYGQRFLFLTASRGARAYFV